MAKQEVAKVAKQETGINPIVSDVLAKVSKFQELGELDLPSDYSPGNALKSAYLIISEIKDKNDKPVTESCSKASIGKALLDMVVQGLSPLKKQCAFVAYGGKLELVREYPGTIALARRYGGVKNVFPYVLYEGDTLKFIINPETGKRSLVEHKEGLENRNNNNILGAYAYLTFQDGSDHHCEYMTMEEIRKAWNQGYAKGQSPAHKNFTQEMAKKTVINRACKLFINSSDDGNIMDSNENENNDYALKSRNEEINSQEKQEISFDDHQGVHETEEKEQQNQHPEKKNEEQKQAKEETNPEGRLF